MISDTVAEDGIHGPLPGRCCFFVERKKRYCKMLVAKGKRLCGEHANSDETTEGEDCRKRIPCPLDAKHTVFEHNLEKHLKKCNSREKPKPVFYVCNINSGFDGLPGTQEDQVPISSLSKEELEMLIRTLKKATSGLNCKLKEQILSHEALQDALNDPKNGDSALKHLHQQSSLLGNMDHLGLLGPNRCFVEFGAGRGKLSHWIDIALQEASNVHFLLVERATTRFKVDGKHRNASTVFERLHIDIQHLALSKVPILEKGDLAVVGIGKHLCGAGTDLALRCLFESSQVTDLETDREPAMKRLKTDSTSDVHRGESAVSEFTDVHVNRNSIPVIGVAVALCCHHRCDWSHYVGKEYFASLGLGCKEFSFFQRMSSWATCGMRRPPAEGVTSDGGITEQTDVEEHDQEGELQPSLSDSLEGCLTVEERENIGHLCKLLIDYGRTEYIKQKGYSAALQYYTKPSISLENVLLTAVPKDA
ncbi:tRNA:m(4)X modification enzyme TRM13 homolog [Protopterus annectens]|uniref:tRNA:m(4)X modification enzyme TRM13 homolog n=1 Tax=Protopterus annectens TaxID=7888 RepID=UPI001CFC363D|nr:tRNA:m(4)X modification enzyme TRM13 homolog [Protopterus annectens]